MSYRARLVVATVGRVEELTAAMPRFASRVRTNFPTMGSAEFVVIAHRAALRMPRGWVSDAQGMRVLEAVLLREAEEHRKKIRQGRVRSVVTAHEASQAARRSK